MTTQKTYILYAKVIITGVIAVLLLTAAFSYSYLYSQTKPASLVFPGGVTYLGPNAPK